MLTAKLKACFLYSKDLLWFNLPFSLFISLVGLASGFPFLQTFCVSLVTGGALLSAYFFGRQRAHQYYFYYNLGISKAVLYGSAFLLDVLLGIGVLIFKNNLR